MECDIYKELSEKLVTLVMYVMNLFPLEKESIQVDRGYLQKTNNYLNDAVSAINKYAVFIPKNWYDKFVIITGLCNLQIQNYDKLMTNRGNVVQELCVERTRNIKNSFDDLVLELRTHINTLGLKENNKHAD